jgi:hypothetical protein
MRVLLFLRASPTEVVSGVANWNIGSGAIFGHPTETLYRKISSNRFGASVLGQQIYPKVSTALFCHTEFLTAATHRTKPPPINLCIPTDRTKLSPIEPSPRSNQAAASCPSLLKCPDQTEPPPTLKLLLIYAPLPRMKSSRVPSRSRRTSLSATMDAIANQRGWVDGGRIPNRGNVEGDQSNPGLYKAPSSMLRLRYIPPLSI